MYSEEYSDDEVEQESGNFIVNFYNNNKVLVWIMIGVIAFILIMTLLTGGGSSKSKDYEIRVLHDGDVIVSVGHSENILTEFKADLSAVPKWSSKNENIVKVDNGNIVGVNYGMAKVTVTYETNNKAYSKDIDVIVADGDPNLTLTNIEFKKGDLFMPLNSTYTIAPVLTPPRAYVMNKVYTSSNERVVRVDNTGLVSSVGEGEATITLNVNDGAFKRDLNVYVSSEYTNSEIIVTPTQIIFDGELRKIKVGSTENLTYTTVPADASRDKLIWKSSDESIVTVDENGKVTAIKGGTATVTVSSVNGVNDKIDIEVENDLVPVTDINLSVTSLSLNVGQTETISPVVVPDNASNKALSFLPGDSTIISVIPSNTGTFANVTALKSGSTTLTIKSFDGVEKTIAVNVTGGGSSGGGGSSSGGGTTIKVRVNGDEPTKQCNNQELTYYNNPTVTVDLSSGVSKIKYCYGTSVCSPNTEATSSTSFTINQSGLIILRIKKYDTNGNEIASSNNNNYVDDALEYYINTKSSGTKCTRSSSSGTDTSKPYTISGNTYSTELLANQHPLTSNTVTITSTNGVDVFWYVGNSLKKSQYGATNFQISANSSHAGTNRIVIKYSGNTSGDQKYFVIQKSGGSSGSSGSSGTATLTISDKKGTGYVLSGASGSTYTFDESADRDGTFTNTISKGKGCIEFKQTRFGEPYNDVKAGTVMGIPVQRVNDNQDCTGEVTVSFKGKDGSTDTEKVTITVKKVPASTAKITISDKQGTGYVLSGASGSTYAFNESADRDGTFTNTISSGSSCIAFTQSRFSEPYNDVKAGTVMGIPVKRVNDNQDCTGKVTVSFKGKDGSTASKTVTITVKKVSKWSCSPSPNGSYTTVCYGAYTSKSTLETYLNNNSSTITTDTYSGLVKESTTHCSAGATSCCKKYSCKKS